VRADPRSRGRERRKLHEEERTRRRVAELAAEEAKRKAIEGLSPRAKKLWARVQDSTHWYPWDAKVPKAMKELEKAGLVVEGGRVARVVLAWMPVGTLPYSLETYPEPDWV
jgi:hypothetical protein